jgi:hypothetical protein
VGAGLLTVTEAEWSLEIRRALINGFKFPNPDFFQWLPKSGVSPALISIFGTWIISSRMRVTRVTRRS